MMIVMKKVELMVNTMTMMMMTKVEYKNEDHEKGEIEET